MEAFFSLSLCIIACMGTLVETSLKYPDLVYPMQIVGISNPDGTCWTGMDLDGTYQRSGQPVPVDPYRWLVGPPPSDKSGVTFPTDHWIELAFGGTIADGTGPDILITEHGKMGEYALICLVDARYWPYPIGIAHADDSGGPDVSFIEMELGGLDLPFEPNCIRIVSLGLGGASPGFDIGTVMARVIHPHTAYATLPNPPDRAKDVSPRPTLGWWPGDGSGGHILHLAKDPADLEMTSYHLPAQTTSFQCGTLELGQVYYWRVDEVSQDQPEIVHTGQVWSFSVAPTYLLDNFENPRITGWQPDPGSWFAENSVGSEWPIPSFLGCQSLVMHFKVYYDVHSGLMRTFEPPLDLTAMGARFLQLAVRGYQGNPRMARLYARLGDGQRTATVYYDLDPYVTMYQAWRTWRIPLDSFNSVDLSDVRSISIGVYGQVGEPAWPVEGWVYIDQILLLAESCDRASCQRPDLDCNCRVDWQDLARLSQDWLTGGTRRLSIREPNTPIAWYQFEGNANDSIGSAHGQVMGDAYFLAGKKGLCLALGTQTTNLTIQDRVRIPNAGEILAKCQKGLTIAFWQQGKDSLHYMDTLVCSDYQYGLADPSIMITIGCWERPGFYQWSFGRPMTIADTIFAPHKDASQWLGRWNHWAFTKDLRTGRMDVFLNGMLISTTPGTPQGPPQLQYLDIGNGWLGHYDGLIDELQIYDYSLSEPEVAYIASAGTGLIQTPPSQRSDLDSDGMVRWHDFALLARQWLSWIAGP